MASAIIAALIIGCGTWLVDTPPGGSDVLPPGGRPVGAPPAPGTPTPGRLPPGNPVPGMLPPGIPMPGNPVPGIVPPTPGVGIPEEGSMVGEVGIVPVPPGKPVGSTTPPG